MGSESKTIGMNRWQPPLVLLFLFEKERAFLADRGRNLFSERGKEPWQGHFKPHMIVRHIDGAARHLAQRPDPKLQMVVRPDFLLDRQYLTEMRSRPAEP